MKDCDCPISNHLFIGKDGEGKAFISKRDTMDMQTGQLYKKFGFHHTRTDVIWLGEDWFPDIPPKTIIKISCEQFKHLGLEDLAHLNFITIGDKDAHSKIG